MKFLIDENDENIRLDAYLSNLIEDISRSKIQSAIKNGNVLINGDMSRKKRKNVVDGVASVVILQSYLDRNNRK